MSSIEVQQAKMVHVKKTKGLRSLFIWTNQKTTPKLSPEVQRLKGQDSKTNLLKPGGNDRNQQVISYRKGRQKEQASMKKASFKAGQPS